MAKNKHLPADRHGNNAEFLSRCSFCGSDLLAEDLTVLEEKEQKSTLHVTCAHCNASSIFFLANNQSGLISLGMATDLDKTEVKNKFLKSAVSADEVIAAHQFASGCEGDLMDWVKNN